MTEARVSTALALLALVACVSGQAQPPACPPDLTVTHGIRPGGNMLRFFSGTNLFGNQEPDIGSGVPGPPLHCTNLTVIDLKDFLTATGSTFCSKPSTSVPTIAPANLAVQTTTSNLFTEDPFFQAQGQCGPRTAFAGQVGGTKRSTLYPNLSYSIEKETNGQVLFGVFDRSKCTANFINMNKFLVALGQSPAKLCSAAKLSAGS